MASSSGGLVMAAPGTSYKAV